jgi:aarF domain-containing kinase
MSPLLQALLRANPKQWTAAAEAVASLARASGTAAARGARRHASNVYASPAFNEVWAEATRFAKLASAPKSGVAAWRALPRLPRLRAPSQLFVLAHRARELPAVAARLPNFSGALVFLLVGGSNLAPATARCLERRDRAKPSSSSSIDRDRKNSSVLVPINAAHVTWVDSLPASLRSVVERALTVLRAIHLSVLFSPVLLFAPVLLYSNFLGDGGAELWYKMLRKTLELGGAAFIKWGQWASTRYDVFPAKLCKELEELQAGAPEHSWRRTKEILERAYGAEQLKEIFAWMDPSPIASGSIAQIHRAKLNAGVAESNGAGPDLGLQRRLLRSVNAGVELAASGEWRRVLRAVLEEWRQSAGKWEWNPGSFIGSASSGGDGQSGLWSFFSRLAAYGDGRPPHPLEGPEGDSKEGRYVAVKVRHPGVVEALRRDFAILMWLASATKDVPFLQPFQLEHTVQQFGAHMLQQVDLTKEAANLSRFKDCFSLWPTVSFPTPVRGLATEEVLIETFESGVSISSFLMDPLGAAAAEDAAAALGAITGITDVGVGSGAGENGRPKTLEDKVEEAATKAAAAAAYAEAVRVPEENKILAALGVKTLLKMLIDDNFLHADLHPGNILVRLRRGGVVGGVAEKEEGEADASPTSERPHASAPTDPKRLVKPEIVILDTGLATELTPHQQASLAEFFQAIIDWDGVGVAEKIISFSSNLSPKLDLEGFKRDISAAVGRFSESTPRAGDCMSAIFETVQHHHVTIDPNVMVAVVTVMVLEGWQFRLDPTINILDYIGDVLKSSFRKHQRLTIADFALRDMWAPFSEPNALETYRGARSSPISAQMEEGHHG